MQTSDFLLLKSCIEDNSQCFNDSSDDAKDVFQQVVSIISKGALQDICLRYKLIDQSFSTKFNLIFHHASNSIGDFTAKIFTFLDILQEKEEAFLKLQKIFEEKLIAMVNKQKQVNEVKLRGIEKKYMDEEATVNELLLNAQDDFTSSLSSALSNQSNEFEKEMTQLDIQIAHEKQHYNSLINKINKMKSDKINPYLEEDRRLALRHEEITQQYNTERKKIQQKSKALEEIISNLEKRSNEETINFESELLEREKQLIAEKKKFQNSLEQEIQEKDSELEEIQKCLSMKTRKLQEFKLAKRTELKTMISSFKERIRGENEKTPIQIQEFQNSLFHDQELILQASQSKFFKQQDTFSAVLNILSSKQGEIDRTNLIEEERITRQYKKEIKHFHERLEEINEQQKDVVKIEEAETIKFKQKKMEELMNKSQEVDRESIEHQKIIKSIINQFDEGQKQLFQIQTNFIRQGNQIAAKRIAEMIRTNEIKKKQALQRIDNLVIMEEMIKDKSEVEKYINTTERFQLLQDKIAHIIEDANNVLGDFTPISDRTNSINYWENEISSEISDFTNNFDDRCKTLYKQYNKTCLNLKDYSEKHNGDITLSYMIDKETQSIRLKLDDDIITLGSQLSNVKNSFSLILQFLQSQIDDIYHLREPIYHLYNEQLIKKRSAFQKRMDEINETIKNCEKEKQNEIEKIESEGKEKLKEIEEKEKSVLQTMTKEKSELIHDGIRLDLKLQALKSKTCPLCEAKKKTIRNLLEQKKVLQTALDNHKHQAIELEKKVDTRWNPVQQTGPRILSSSLEPRRTSTRRKNSNKLTRTLSDIRPSTAIPPQKTNISKVQSLVAFRRKSKQDFTTPFTNPSILTTIDSTNV